MRLRIVGCLVGIHRKKWVGIFDYPKAERGSRCSHREYVFSDGLHWCEVCRQSIQIARWACDVCVKMGERVIVKSEGIYKIEYGCLVPDEKRWGDGSDLLNKVGGSI